MLIDCDSCAMRDIACADCVVTMLLAEPALPGSALDLDDAEQDAVDTLAASGLISPLRLVPIPRHDLGKRGCRHIA